MSMPVLLAEAELRHEAVRVVDVGLAREHVVVRVAGRDDRLVHVDRAVAARLVVAEAMRRARGAGSSRDRRSSASACACPTSAPTSARNGLIVEPGGYAPRSGRLSSGLSGDSFSSSQFAESMPSTNRLGSKPGFETNASTSPVAGSIATSAPRRVAERRLGDLLQLDVERERAGRCPTSAASRDSVRTARPPASTSTSSTPVVPCSSRS